MLLPAAVDRVELSDLVEEALEPPPADDPPTWEEGPSAGLRRAQSGSFA
jgi:hypothetical protein